MTVFDIFVNIYLENKGMIYMDNTVRQLFEEKNKKILLDKLLLDIENNSHSLSLTVNNKILLSSQKLIKKINDVFMEYHIKYDLKGLTELIKQEELEIKELTLKLLDKRRKELAEKVKTKDDITLEDVAIIIDESLKNFRKSFDVDMNKAIYIDMFNRIVEKYKLTEEEAKEKINFCLSSYDHILSDSILDSINDRNSTLKNITKATYEHYIDMNYKTVGGQNLETVVGQNPKIKEKTTA